MYNCSLISATWYISVVHDYNTDCLFHQKVVTDEENVTITCATLDSDIKNNIIKLPLLVGMKC